MSNRSSRLEIYLPLLTLLSDAAAIFSAFLSSYYIRFGFEPFLKFFPVTKGVPELHGYILFALLIIPVWLIVFQTRKMYRIRRNVFVFDEFFVIIKCVTIGMLFAMGMVFILKGDFPYSRLVFALIWATSIVFITIGRYVILKIEKNLYNKGLGMCNVAVLGTNEMAAGIYDKFRSDKFAGYEVLGYFDYPEALSNEMGERHRLGALHDVPSRIRELNIEKLFISIPSTQHEVLEELFRLCEGINVEFMYSPDFVDLITSRMKIEEVDGVPFMRLKKIPMNAWNRMLKRAFDIAFSLLFILILSPVLLVISLLVKITSHGPLFYKQERVGLDGKKFMILKFRSMRIDAEKSGPQMAKRDDDRYTPIGKFIRKYSLDELPQFFNVLGGSMSIVGPRPEREFFINTMKESIRRYLERHRVKCGITGWAQVNGARGSDSSMQQRIDYDIYYIENWSIAFDMKIIFKTLKEVFFSERAF